MPKNICFKFIGLVMPLVFLSGTAVLRAEGSFRVYPAPAGEPLSTDFKVSINQTDVPVYLAAVATADPARRAKISTADVAAFRDHTSFVSFDMGNSVTVTVTCPNPVESVKLLPRSSGVAVDGNRVTFTISRPQPLELEVNGDWVHGLQVFANPMETNAPNPNDPNVIYFGPGIHQIEDLKVGSGKTVYVAGGAVLYGKADPAIHGGAVISLRGNNIVLRGRGVIDGSLCPLHTRNLLAITGTNVLLEGVVLRDSSTWTVPIRHSAGVTVDNIKLFGYRGNSDGIDICNSRNVTVEHSYLRTMDDLIVVKTPDRDGESRDIEAKQCVLWNELAHALSIGAELRANVENVHFSDCDVIHDKGREWLLRVFHCDAGDVHDVTFDNIRIEESRRLISLWIGRAIWSRDAECGHIENVTFRNIRAVGPNPSIDLKGYDSEHLVRGARFENVVVNGKPLKRVQVHQNAFVQDVSVEP
ncbi:MAG TPA: glycosyl hydrolase family 28 protein [Candidatus Sulfotelmatobacter sp.]|nr:glycosyl hydrolase family 28 protein [Candidatus Sulfotelmatobacter sp.]